MKCLWIVFYLLYFSISLGQDFNKQTNVTTDSTLITPKINKPSFSFQTNGGILPIGFVDVDLRKTLKFNYFEGLRLTIAGLTNANLAKNFKINYNYGYGIKDGKSKYYFEPSLLIHKKSNSWATISYTNDIVESATISYLTDVPKIEFYDPRPVTTTTFYNFKCISVGLKSKFSEEFKTNIGIMNTVVVPYFNYYYLNNKAIFSRYTVSASQFGIEFIPKFNKKSKYNLQFLHTIPGFFDNSFEFSKIEFSAKHEFLYLSGQKTTLFFQSGFGFGNLPLTHSYSLLPNNLPILKKTDYLSLSAENSFETMYFNEFFSNKFVALEAKHSLKKMPWNKNCNSEISFVSRACWGVMENKSNHQGIDFKTLDNGFYESGIEINQIFRGLGMVFYYRYGANKLPDFAQNFSVKFSYSFDFLR